MKAAFPACALLLCCALSPTWIRLAQDGRQESHEQHEGPETELSSHMEKIEDTVKVLRKSLKDPALHQAALEALLEIQRETLTCKTLAPAAAEKLPEAERAAFVTAYRRTMVDFMLRQLELEAALLDGDAEAVKASFERFRAMEDSSHERFAPEDD